MAVVWLSEVLPLPPPPCGHLSRARTYAPVDDDDALFQQPALAGPGQ